MGGPLSGGGQAATSSSRQVGEGGRASRKGQTALHTFTPTDNSGVPRLACVWARTQGFHAARRRRREPPCRCLTISSISFVHDCLFPDVPDR